MLALLLAPPEVHRYDTGCCENHSSDSGQNDDTGQNHQQ